MVLKKLLITSFFVLILGAAAYFYLSKEKTTAYKRPVSNTIKYRFPITGDAEFVDSQQADFSQLQEHVEKQWALQDIGIIDALKQIQPTNPENAQDIVVAVIDTGIHKKHPCFKGQLWVNTKEIPNNNKDDDGNGFADDIHGWNFVDNNNNIQDYHGHGTHVSGIVAAKGKDNCKVVGVSPQVKIMTLKYFSPNSNNGGNVKNTVKSIEYAVQNGADIINYSGGGPGDNLEEKTAVAKAADKGIIFVAALGNDGSEIGKKIQYYPASYNLSNIIAVQSHNEKRLRVESSNYKAIPLPGPKQKQTAPGEDIISTLPPKLYLQGKLKSLLSRSLAFAPVKQDNYGLMTGTSQGTAVTTGVIALAKLARPHWSMGQIISLIDQSEKLSAYEAVSMRPQNVDFSDQISQISVPYDPKKGSDILENPRNQKALHKTTDIFEVIKNIDKLLDKNK